MINDLLKHFTIQRLILFSDIIYKSMASAHSSNPRQPSKMKPPTATTSPTKDQSASNPRLSEHQITDTPSSTDPTPIAAILKDDRKVVSYILENNIR